MIDGLGRGFVHGTTTVGAHGGLEGRSELRRTERTCGFSSGLREGSAPPSQGEIKSGEFTPSWYLILVRKNVLILVIRVIRGKPGAA